MKLLCLAVMLCAVADPPPQVIKGACPFECCQFGQWTAYREIKLYDKPGGSEVVAVIAKGQAVTALTGEQHVKPLRIEVVHDHGRFKKGDVIHLFGHVAECGIEYAVNGVKVDLRVREDDCLDDFLPEDLAKCKGQGTAECWGRISGSIQERDVWWVRIRAGKKEGWTREAAGNFSGLDRCG